MTRQRQIASGQRGSVWRKGGKETKLARRKVCSRGLAKRHRGMGSETQMNAKGVVLTTGQSAWGRGVE